MAANFLYAINQFFHNVLVVAFVGGSLYVVLLIRERRSGEGKDAADAGTEAFLLKQPRREFWILVALMTTGANFGVLSLALYGKLPDLTLIAWSALAGKILLGLICLGILWRLWKRIVPELALLSQREGSGGRLNPSDQGRLATLPQRWERSWLTLLFLGWLILFCAAVLRYTS
ncbi:MAG: hypothetical protein KGL31_03755 [candidate division NC10 bacterium]|nr:hypothetical protein [candidate division NC10 bacterium]MDE2321018.1 hypothetical protein [candidate division NC10 bacterium]